LTRPVGARKEGHEVARVFLEPMMDAAESLKDLKDALETLSPRDFAAWNDRMESRLTERLRRRQQHGAPTKTPPPHGEETTDA
jgi:hypothetical protein